MKHIITIKADVEIGTESMMEEISKRIDDLIDDYSIEVCTKETTIRRVWNNGKSTSNS